MNNILHINSSGRYQNSLTRHKSGVIVEKLSEKYSDSSVISRDLALGIPFVDEQWIAANFSDPDERTELQNSKLIQSDALINELQIAKHIVIGVPIYNFGIPAALKAWIDMVARVGVTFKYTENGVDGLLKNKKAYLVLASGGVTIGSELDFASTHLTHVMGFLGIEDVSIVDANISSENA